MNENRSFAKGSSEVCFSPPMARISGSGSERVRYSNHTRFVLNIEEKGALLKQNGSQEPPWHKNCKEMTKQRFARCCLVASIAE
ncbi:hypothetical protein [Desulfofustis glycolicus]|uniref:hypothetical protein n=1 Tax=Desulfofustis glycolicus TaxID=51195 RepID=UPI0011611519|nr:hypothetical protein [Desulfofustis glycolicus]MCB2215179.1 hypothetical protein [Desulfobulbaceae bacterium]